MIERDENRYHGFDLPWWLKIAFLPIAAGAAVVNGVKSGAKKIVGKVKGKK